MAVTINEMREKTPKELLKEQRKGAAKPLLWVGIASMVMAFAGLTSGYVVSRSSLIQKERWMVFELPSYFYISSAVIILSSITVIWAVKSIKKGEAKSATTALWLTLVLGLLFAVFQVLGWKALHDAGVFFTGQGSNVAGSWVYAITFFHLLHMIAGLISLSYTTLKSSKGLYSSTNTLGIELTATFWHFLDIVWIYLFIFLLFIR